MYWSLMIGLMPSLTTTSQQWPQNALIMLLLLRTDCFLPHFKRFCFEKFWPKCDSYLRTIEEAWNSVPFSSSVDAFRLLDCKLRHGKSFEELKCKVYGDRCACSWPYIEKEIVLRLELAQDHRSLSACEVALTRQRSRIQYLVEGDAITEFFHLQAFHRSCKNYIEKLTADNSVLVQDEEVADAVFDHFSCILGEMGVSCARLTMLI